MFNCLFTKKNSQPGCISTENNPVRPTYNFTITYTTGVIEKVIGYQWWDDEDPWVGISTLTGIIWIMRDHIYRISEELIVDPAPTTTSSAATTTSAEAN